MQHNVQIRQQLMEKAEREEKGRGPHCSPRLLKGCLKGGRVRKLEQKRNRLDIRKNTFLGKRFFNLRTVKKWNRLLIEAEQSPCLEVFKVILNKLLSNPIRSHHGPCFEQEVVPKTSLNPL